MASPGRPSSRARPPTPPWRRPRTSAPAQPRPGAGRPKGPGGKPSPAAQAKPASRRTGHREEGRRQAAAKPAAGGTAGGPTPQQIALGDSIFHGQVAGGTCTACHGQDAKGTAVAPDLTDQQWINGDGSYDFIVRTVTNGVPEPKQHPAPMPPKGGARSPTTR